MNEDRPIIQVGHQGRTPWWPWLLPLGLFVLMIALYPEGGMPEPGTLPAGWAWVSLTGCILTGALLVVTARARERGDR